ncbi:MAG TPA: hypothetical protein VF928_06495 [Usitatibacteraceae bacterium]
MLQQHFSIALSLLGKFRLSGRLAFFGLDAFDQLPLILALLRFCIQPGCGQLYFNFFDCAFGNANILFEHPLALGINFLDGTQNQHAFGGLNIDRTFALELSVDKHFRANVVAFAANP